MRLANPADLSAARRSAPVSASDCSSEPCLAIQAIGSRIALDGATITASEASSRLPGRQCKKRDAQEHEVGTREPLAGAGLDPLRMAGRLSQPKGRQSWVCWGFPKTSKRGAGWRSAKTASPPSGTSCVSNQHTPAHTSTGPRRRPQGREKIKFRQSGVLVRAAVWISFALLCARVCEGERGHSRHDGILARASLRRLTGEATLFINLRFQVPCSWTRSGERVVTS